MSQHSSTSTGRAFHRGLIHGAQHSSVVQNAGQWWTPMQRLTADVGGKNGTPNTEIGLLACLHSTPKESIHFVSIRVLKRNDP